MQDIQVYVLFSGRKSCSLFSSWHAWPVRSSFGTSPGITEVVQMNFNPEKQGSSNFVCTCHNSELSNVAFIPSICDGGRFDR